jgi:hypothetical protein
LKKLASATDEFRKFTSPEKLMQNFKSLGNLAKASLRALYDHVKSRIAAEKLNAIRERLRKWFKDHGKRKDEWVDVKSRVLSEMISQVRNGGADFVGDSSLNPLNDPLLNLLWNSDAANELGLHAAGEALVEAFNHLIAELFFELVVEVILASVVAELVPLLPLILGAAFLR